MSGECRERERDARKLQAFFSLQERETQTLPVFQNNNGLHLQLFPKSLEVCILGVILLHYRCNQALVLILQMSVNNSNSSLGKIKQTSLIT